MSRVRRDFTYALVIMTIGTGRTPLARNLTPVPTGSAASGERLFARRCSS